MQKLGLRKQSCACIRASHNAWFLFPTFGLFIHTSYFVHVVRYFMGLKFANLRHISFSCDERKDLAVMLLFLFYSSGCTQHITSNQQFDAREYWYGINQLHTQERSLSSQLPVPMSIWSSFSSWCCHHRFAMVLQSLFCNEIFCCNCGYCRLYLDNHEMCFK